MAALGAAKADVDGASTASFQELIDPLKAPPEAELTSTDGSAMRIVGKIPGEKPQVLKLLVPVRPIIEAARAAHPTTTIHVIDSTFINEDINSLISHDRL